MEVDAEVVEEKLKGEKEKEEKEEEEEEAEKAEEEEENNSDKIEQPSPGRWGTMQNKRMFFHRQQR